MNVGDLVWIVGRPKDGWVKSLGVIVRIDSSDVYVSPTHNHDVTYKVMFGDLEPFHKK